MRGDRHDEKENNTKKRQSCATIEWPDYPDHSPALIAGCRQALEVAATLGAAEPPARGAAGRADVATF